MSWQIINVEPAFGVCDQCKKHDCGIIDGEHKWIMTSIYDQSGDAIVIGYKCVELWANNLGISREVVEHSVLLTPTDEQIGDYIRKGVLKAGISEHSHILHTLDRNGIKQWMTEHDVAFVPQWGEERLREEALKHV